jgi:hypothetical protein
LIEAFEAESNNVIRIHYLPGGTKVLNFELGRDYVDALKTLQSIIARAYSEDERLKFIVG